MTDLEATEKDISEQEVGTTQQMKEKDEYKDTCSTLIDHIKSAKDRILSCDPYKHVESLRHSVSMLQDTSEKVLLDSVAKSLLDYTSRSVDWMDGFLEGDRKEKLITDENIASLEDGRHIRLPLIDSIMMHPDLLNDRFNEALVIGEKIAELPGKAIRRTLQSSHDILTTEKIIRIKCFAMDMLDKVKELHPEMISDILKQSRHYFIVVKTQAIIFVMQTKKTIEDSPVVGTLEGTFTTLYKEIYDFLSRNYHLIKDKIHGKQAYLKILDETEEIESLHTDSTDLIFEDQLSETAESIITIEKSSQEEKQDTIYDSAKSEEDVSPQGEM